MKDIVLIESSELDMFVHLFMHVFSIMIICFFMIKMIVLDSVSVYSNKKDFFVQCHKDKINMTTCEFMYKCGK